MDFQRTEEQSELRSAVRAFLDRECPPAFVRAVAEGRAAPDALWPGIVELGWPALTVPEDGGGLGLGFVELVLVVEEMGAHLLPGPFVPTVCQLAPALRETGATQHLAAVAAGELTGALAVDGGVEARPDGDGWALEGRKRWVTEGDRVDEFVVAADVEGGGPAGLFLVARRDVKVTVPDPLDPTRSHADVDLGGVRVGTDRVLTLDGAAALRRALEAATVAVAAEMVGACGALLGMTLDHAKAREQFGRPIGAFQAVQHKLADMYVAVERARSVVYFAAMAIAEDDPRRTLATSMAKAAAGDAERLVVRDGIQLHGGIAYTWEHDAHLYVKRLMADAAVLGTARDHRGVVAAALLDPP